MNRFAMICVAVMLAVGAASAQQRLFCDRSRVAGTTRGLVQGSSVSTRTGEWHVPVVFAAFKDVPFKYADAVAKWDAMLNQEGYTADGVAGSASAYFEKQSNGKFKLHFDCLGPVTLPDSMKYYGANRNGAGDDMRASEIVQKACEAVGADWTLYDWDGNDTIDVVMVVYAQYGENRGGTTDAIWPHMSSVYHRQVGGKSLYTYACVSELNAAGEVDGYATFCHEFSHTLGLPDLYPTDTSIYSYFDEWDLMDGGNYSNGGRAIPNYSAFERHLCGWLDYEELNAETHVAAMPAYDDEPKAYVIRDDNDPEHYYVLENRQQRGFDWYVPGNGLLITEVNHYDGTLFPNMKKVPQITLVAADNRSYKASEKWFESIGKYTVEGRNRYLSLAAYPYVVGDSVNNHLTTTSVPAMTIAGKPLTQIQQLGDGSVAFDFMKTDTGIRQVAQEDDDAPWYDLQGRRLQGAPQQHGVYIRNKKKVAF